MDCNLFCLLRAIAGYWLVLLNLNEVHEESCLCNRRGKEW